MQITFLGCSLLNPLKIGLISNSGYFISRLIRFFPSRIQKEIIYPIPNKNKLSKEALKIRQNGFVKLNLKDNKTTNEAILRIEKDVLKALIEKIAIRSPVTTTVASGFKPCVHPCCQLTRTSRLKNLDQNIDQKS